MNGIRVRRAEDVEQLVAALRSVHEASGYPAAWPADPAGWLSPSNVVQAWVGEQGGRIAGHVMLRRLRTGAGSVSRLFVAPPGRGVGLGKRLLQTAIEENAGAELHLTVDSIAREAVVLYEACGFRLTHSEPAAWSTPDGRQVTMLHYTLRV